MERINKTIKILQAFKENKRVEYFFNDKWFGASNLNIVLEYLYKDIDSIRITKEPTYRPYKNAEEYLKASKEHGPYIINHMFHKIPISISDASIVVYWNTEEGTTRIITYGELLKKCTWQDGTPCGILE